MPINLDAIGIESDPHESSWDSKDCLLYSLGVGAGAGDPTGFELEFTKPVNPKTAADLASYSLKTYTYIFQAKYGSPEVDHTTPTIKSAKVGPDGKTVKLVVEGLQIGHVHELNSAGVRSKEESYPLLHEVAYYTLWHLPKN